MKKYILIGLVALTSGGLLVACGGSSSNNQEMINGIAVPPDPGEAGKETLAGIDSNSNGVRDDVERKIAEEYGNDSAVYEESLDHVKVLEPLFNNSVSNESVENYAKKLYCSSSKQLEEFQDIENYYNNSIERRKKYAKELSGMLIGGFSCE